MKTTLSEIRSFWAIDITRFSHDSVEALKEEEQGFREVAWNHGNYGQNGLVIQGYRSGKLYKICGRVQILRTI